MDTTKLTEIATALGVLGYDPSLRLPTPPPELRNVPGDIYLDIVETWGDPERTPLVASAWENGRYFAAAHDALRGRRARLVEWTGPTRPPGDEVAPIDLRVDHVYLVSCKYRSRITVNASPHHLFDRLLTGGYGRRGGNDWYRQVAPRAFADLWAAAAPSVGRGDCSDPTSLDRATRKIVAGDLKSGWPDGCAEAYAALCSDVSAASAARWQEALDVAGSGAAEQMLWRLLRIGSAPYFVLGADAHEPVRRRVASPWDWRQAYRFRSLEFAPGSGGQPTVVWRARVRRHDDEAELTVAGHVEIRWSHGRFSGPPEAKVYLDTPPADVPGYWPLR